MQINFNQLHKVNHDDFRALFNSFLEQKATRK
jgi:hypothetical protein